MSLLREYPGASGGAPWSVGSSSGATLTIDSTGATAIVIFVGSNGGFTITGKTDSQGGGSNTWVEASNSALSGNAQVRALVCCGSNFTKRGSSHVITLTFSGPVDRNIHVLVFNGREYTFTAANGSGNIETSAIATTSGNAGAAAFTPAANNALIVGAISTSQFYTTSSPLSGNATITTSSATTSGGMTLMSAYLEQATAAAFNTAFSWTGAARFSGILVPLDAAAGPVITGPSGSAGASSSTANLAEIATTGPTFTTSTALGGGYPTLTGADAASFTITTLSSTSFRVDPVTPFNFESLPHSNPFNITFNASASVNQTCTITVTNVNEAPTFSGTVSVPTLTQGTAMTPVDAGALFSDQDASDTAAYSAVGVWPAGVTVNSSTGVISGTPSAAAVYSNLRVRRTDSGALTADSNLFTITVAASGGVTFSGTVPAQSGTVGTAFSLALTSYFSGTGTYAVQAGILPPGLGLDSSTGAITGAPTTAGTYSGVVIRKTAASGSPATADTNAFAFTIAAAPAVAGFDLDTAAGCVFGSVAGSLTSISREVGVAYKVGVYNTSTRALIFESASLTTNSAGRLSRFTTNLCTVGVIYDLVAKRVSDGAIAAFRLAAT